MDAAGQPIGGFPVVWANSLDRLETAGASGRWPPVLRSLPAISVNQHRVEKSSPLLSRRMIMTGLRASLGRRHFLASTIVGSVGLLLPLSPAHPATTPPAPPG